MVSGVPAHAEICAGAAGVAPAAVAGVMVSAPMRAASFGIGQVVHIAGPKSPLRRVIEAVRSTPMGALKPWHLAVCSCPVLVAIAVVLVVVFVVRRRRG
jgi:hypothetical protein